MKQSEVVFTREIERKQVKDIEKIMNEAEERFAHVSYNVALARQLDSEIRVLQAKVMRDVNSPTNQDQAKIANVKSQKSFYINEAREVLSQTKSEDLELIKQLLKYPVKKRGIYENWQDSNLFSSYSSELIKMYRMYCHRMADLHNLEPLKIEENKKRPLIETLMLQPPQTTIKTYPSSVINRNKPLKISFAQPIRARLDQTIQPGYIVLNQPTRARVDQTIQPGYIVLNQPTRARVDQTIQPDHIVQPTYIRQPVASTPPVESWSDMFFAALRCCYSRSD